MIKTFEIFKQEDYYIEIDSEEFKKVTDQFEGLINLLKDKGIIPKENKWVI